MAKTKTITVSQAVVLFDEQVQHHRGLPLEVRIPTETTNDALADAEKRRNLTPFAAPEALFADLGSDC